VPALGGLKENLQAAEGETLLDKAGLAGVKRPFLTMRLED